MGILSKIFGKKDELGQAFETVNRLENNPEKLNAYLNALEHLAVISKTRRMFSVAAETYERIADVYELPDEKFKASGCIGIGHNKMMARSYRERSEELKRNHPEQFRA